MVDPTGGSPHREHVPTISELIHTQRDSTGLTYRQMAERAAAAGFPVKYQQFQELATQGPKGWPKEAATIKGLAAALEVSERSIVLSFARSFGLEVTEGSSLLEVLLPGATRDIDPGLQRAIAGVVRAAIEAQHEAGETGGDTAPIGTELTTHESVTAEGQPVLEIREESSEEGLSRTGEPPKHTTKDTQG